MAHDHVHESLQKQNLSARLLLFTMMLGGVLVFLSYLAPLIYPDQTQLVQISGEQVERNTHADFMALAGALLLGLPLIWTALKNLWHGVMHMDELVAMAVGAAIAIGEYQEAGLIAFFMIIVELIESRAAMGAARLSNRSSS